MLGRGQSPDSQPFSHRIAQKDTEKGPDSVQFYVLLWQTKDYDVTLLTRTLEGL